VQDQKRPPTLQLQSDWGNTKKKRGKNHTALIAQGEEGKTLFVRIGGGGRTTVLSGGRGRGPQRRKLQDHMTQNKKFVGKSKELTNRDDENDHLDIKREIGLGKTRK